MPNSMDICDLGGGSGPPTLHTGVLRISGSRRTTTTTEDRNIQCKNITKRRACASTGRRTERKQHEMG